MNTLFKDTLIKLMVLLLLALPFSVRAQKWSSIEGEYFDVMYTEGEGAARSVHKVAEDFYPKVTGDLGYSPKRKITIWFFESRRDFRRTFSAPIQDWAAGYAYPLRARIAILDPAYVMDKKINLSHLVKHEITHVILGLYLGQNLRYVPRWFNEGVAMYESGEWNYGHYWTILTGSLSNSLIPLYELAEDFPQNESQARLAYAQSCSIITFMVEKYGDNSLRECVSLIAEGRGIDDALAGAIGMDAAWLERKWMKSIKSRYRWISVISSWVVLWGLVVLIAFIAYWRRRMRNRRIIQQWEEEDEMWWGFDEDEDMESHEDISHR